MNLRLWSLAAVLVAVHAHAFQLPFRLSSILGDSQTVFSVPKNVPPIEPSNKVAIIGAGAGGSSAAFWIAGAKRRFGLDVEIDVFERESYVGGRSTVVYPYDDLSLEPVELGASIFAKANKNMWRAIEEFGLETTDFEDDDGTLGIWDGEQFLLTMGGRSFYSGWLDTLKIVWRYGINGPRRTQAIVNTMVQTISKLYSPSSPTFSNISTLADTLEWSPIVAQRASEFFDSQGIDRRWTREMVEAATRVNYGQNIDSIHALEGLVSLAASGAASTKGGNYQVFERFLQHSNASVHLNTTVKSISKPSEDGPWMVQTSASRAAQPYRAIIIAAPFHSTSIHLTYLSDTLASKVPPQPYVHLHVTLLSTTAPAPSAEYFGLKPGSKVPTSVLTTWESVRRQDATKPEFNSLTYHGKIKTRDGENQGKGPEEWVVKIFSKERLEDAWLKEVFDGEVGWVYRKEWDAYPILPPTTTFPPLKLEKGLYYVNAFEPLISTMETETLSSRNVVDLLLRDEFGSGICDEKSTQTETDIYERPPEDAESGDHDFVLGWDCVITAN